MASETFFGTGNGTTAASWQSCSRKNRNKKQGQNFYFSIRASQSMDNKNRVYKQLGFFSLKKNIEDTVLRAETLAPTALELEEASKIEQEEMIRGYNLWDDPAKSNEILVKLADSAKVVDALKDLKYKAEEAKLISQLVELDAINYGLFKQAYDASLNVSKFLDQYEMSKLLHGPYDVEGACVTIKAGPEGICSEIWADQLVTMYRKWAEKQGYIGRLVEKCSGKNSIIKSATIEFEFEYAFGYLSGERGVHFLISSQSGSDENQTCSACVDVVPLFLRTAYDLQISDEDLIFSSSSFLRGEGKSHSERTVCIKHIPTGITVQSSGERSHFANKMKALHRLKAKLLVIAREQGVSTVGCINRDAITGVWQRQTRRYISHPYKLVHDVKTGIQLPDLNSVLDGNIEPLIGAHINIRQSSDTD